ncbi:MAG TPA: response regulator [Armatimonadetes bacterium]|jgi:CheY-like chemotaxis protein|nr:response regulator [Armatimonadota bacterium]
MGSPGLRVLVADDEAMVRESICDVLRASGYEVCASVASGEAAVECASRLHPDVVLMDIRMPGMGGLDAARLIRGLPQPVPVVFLTALGDREMIERAADSGGFGYLVKPIHGHQIGPMLHTAVRRFQELIQARGDGPSEAAVQPTLDRLAEHARSAGLEDSVEEFLAGLCSQLEGVGAAIEISEPGAAAPVVPACWGKVPPADAPVWMPESDETPDITRVPILDADSHPMGTLFLFDDPVRVEWRQDAGLLREYATGLGRVLAAMRAERPLAWRCWLQADRRESAS